MVYIQFLISSLIIIFAGVKLTKYADILCERIQVGKVWIGVVLLGLVTSLPEAVTSLAAVIQFQAIDLAVGNVVGSNCFNPCMIVAMDLVYRHSSVTDQVHFDRARYMPAVFAICLTIILLLEVQLSPLVVLPKVFHLSLGSLAIIAVYIVGMKILSGLETNHIPLPVVEPGAPVAKQPLKMLALKLAGTMILVIGGSVMLADTADQIAEITGLGETFVGTLFLAIVTSFPELVVTISALKMGGVDLAIGNIFGSNMTNMFIIGLCDLFTRGGPILAGVSKTHVFTGLLSILLTYIALTGIKTNNKRVVVFGLCWDSLLLSGLFISGMWVVYLLK